MPIEADHVKYNVTIIQKYVLHCKALKNKKDKSSEMPHKVTSDLALLKDVKNIDKALSVLQSNPSTGVSDQSDESSDELESHVSRAHCKYIRTLVYDDT